MKTLWCWRCQLEIPMLDETEYERLFAEIRRCKVVRPPDVDEHSGPSDPELARQRIFAPALRLYEELTGFHETNVGALFHHRISLYGPPCTRCGKVLRTPVASGCVECGLPREPGPWQLQRSSHR